MATLPLVVLLSGYGSNLQAIIDAQQRGELPVEIRAVISNRPQVLGLERAAQAGIPSIVLDHTRFATRAAFDLALQEKIDALGAELVVLAGFMRILTPEFVQHYAGRMLNVHPSLLPRHRGLNTHALALAAGDTHHGASIHFVTPELDGGPVIAQARLQIKTGDTAATLAARVSALEHVLYPRVIRWYAARRLLWHSGNLLLDGQPLTAPVMVDFAEISGK